MPDDMLWTITEGLYEAAVGERAWEETGHRLKQWLGAGAASLWLSTPEGVPMSVLHTENVPEAEVRRYSAYYRRHDPWVQGFAHLRAAAPAAARGAVLGQSLVPAEVFRRSEYYQDFARGLDHFHAIGHAAALAPGVAMTLGLHRAESLGAFGPVEQQRLDAVLPHLRQALRIHLRLNPPGEPPHGLGAAALDALPLPAWLLDAEVRVVQANLAAEAMVRGDAPLRMARGGPPAALRLSALWDAEAAALDRLVRGVASRRRPGGGLRLHDADGQPRIAAVAMPLPARYAPGPARLGGDGTVPGYALLLARDLTRPARPPPALLQDLFGFTRSEAEVALALAGGLPARQVARERGVAAPTVRSQVRAVLEKSGAANLRDLERLLASLPGL